MSFKYVKYKYMEGTHVIKTNIYYLAFPYISGRPLTGILLLLHHCIKLIQTTLYQPQTDSLVERFNGTLKSMLQKTAVEEGKDWDRLLPYFLFAVCLL